MWIVYGLLSALFAALTSILAKSGMERVDSNLAAGLRIGVAFLLLWAIVFATGKHRGLTQIGTRALITVTLSGIAAGLSWVLYYKALQVGEAAKVMSLDKMSIVFGLILAFTVLREPALPKSIIGGLLITAGAAVMVL